MKPKRFYLELPPRHTELADQEKEAYRHVKQWRYEQHSHGSFLDRDGVLRRSVRQVEGASGKGIRDEVLGGLLITVGLILWFLLGYALVG